MKRVFILAIMLAGLATAQAVHAAPKTKATQQGGKERLVLMPLRVPEADKELQGAMETALVEGLEQKYEVFAGQRVRQTAKEIFSKETKTAKHDCDETRCMQDIAMAFQAELIATATVTKQDGGYFLALSIQNIMDEKAIYSQSQPCKSCDSFQVVDKLKLLAGGSAATASVPAAPTVKGIANDADSMTWAEVVKGNTIDDYKQYLDSFPQGKYARQAAEQKRKLEEYAKAKAEADAANAELNSWNAAAQADTQPAYDAYLKQYPTGPHAALARMKGKKAAESFQKEHPPFRDCPDCADMVVIPAGSFDMGSGNGGESPQHRVSIKSFAIGKFEVTQKQWRDIMGNNPSQFQDCGDNCPVEQVSWDDAQEFIQRLNLKTGKHYRLPTEAEWEYACKAGKNTEYCGGDDVNAVAWYRGNSGKTTNPVGSKQANAFGLYDMSGNVDEWVQDRWHFGAPAGSEWVGAPNDGSEWEISEESGLEGKDPVRRGGSWVDKPEHVRAAYRYYNAPSFRDESYGFRLARTLP